MKSRRLWVIAMLMVSFPYGWKPGTVPCLRRTLEIPSPDHIGAATPSSVAGEGAARTASSEGLGDD